MNSSERINQWTYRYFADWERANKKYQIRERKKK